MDDDASEKAFIYGSKHVDDGSFSKSEDLNSSEASVDVVYEGPVYHVGINQLGHQFYHPRFIRIRGAFVEMYKKEPARGQKPIRMGVVGQFFKIEDLGRRKFDNKDLYVLKISNALDDTTKGEIACKTAIDAQKWRDAFLQAKDEAGAKFQKGSGHRPEKTDEFNLSGHRPHLRRYARDLTKLIRIGKGSERLFGYGKRSSQVLGPEITKEGDDILDEQDWRCVRTVNGIRILEDAVSQANQKEKVVILKSVGVIEASPSAVFEMLIDVQSPHRKEWDILTGDLKLVKRIDGHCDIVYGSFDPKYLRRWNSKRDFLFSRFWRHDPDNTYTIFQSSTTHKDFQKKQGFRRIKLNTTAWEIKPVPFNAPNSSRSLVTQTMEIRSTGWGQWRKKYFAKLDKTMPYIVLCQVAGLRDYFASNPVPDDRVSSKSKIIKSTLLGDLNVAAEVEDVMHDEFYDALAAVGEEDEEDSDDEELNSQKLNSHRFRNIAWGLKALTPAKSQAEELVSSSSPVENSWSQFKGSLPLAFESQDSNCWTDPGGSEFMVRGKTYARDCVKVSGGDPLLKLIAVDWFESQIRIDSVATNKNSLVQSEAGKRVPFLLVVNLQVPATPNYSLVFYFGSTKPICKGSLLDQFVDGSAAYRDSRFKLIPRIVEGYWFVKRAVGTKACLLGKAVTCRYIRQENFLEIDVDIGSSSVARSIINLVLGHITNLTVDMAILIEAKDEVELPEYLLGTTRVSRVEPKLAKTYQ